MQSLAGLDKNINHANDYVSQVVQKRAQLIGPIRKMLIKYRIPLSEVDAEDLYQSVFIKFTSIVETAPERIFNPVTFFAGMLRHTVLNSVRAYRRSQFRSRVPADLNNNLETTVDRRGDQLEFESDVFSAEVFDNEPVLNGGVDPCSIEDLVTEREMIGFILGRLTTYVTKKKDVDRFQNDIKILEIMLATDSFDQVDAVLNPDSASLPDPDHRKYRYQYTRCITTIRKIFQQLNTLA